MTLSPHLKHHHSQPAHMAPPLFDSFWLGGFESACQINTQGIRIDMIAATQHDVRAHEDYERLRAVGIRAARDGIRWPSIETSPNHFNWSSFLPMVRAANQSELQIIWNLLHYGWPTDIDILSSKFAERFARFCRHVAQIIRNESDHIPYFVPVNEISFLAWAMGERGIVQPLHLGKAWEIKKQLIRAAIAGMEAVWEIEPRARFIHVDPVIHVMPPRNRPDLAQQAAMQRAGQFEAWDMLAGTAEAALGGHRKYLDIVGVNFYHSNQFESPDVRLRWEDSPRDDRWVPFHHLLDEVHHRYKRPVLVSETSHFGVGRGDWIREIAQEVYIARLQGIPVEGVCLYPILDRPDWENPSHWHNSGLWDLRETAGGKLERVINDDYLAALRASQSLLAEVNAH